MPSLVVRTVLAPVATLVTISGEVDLATIARVRECLATIPDRDTVVEMSDVALLSAAGVRALLGLQGRLAAAGARLVLAAATRPVRRILTVTGPDPELLTARTIDDALTWLQALATTQPTSTQGDPGHERRQERRSPTSRWRTPISARRLSSATPWRDATL